MQLEIESAWENSRPIGRGLWEGTSQSGITDGTGVTSAMAPVPGSGLITNNEDESNLVAALRAQGATNAQMQTSLEDLRGNRTNLPAS